MKAYVFLDMDIHDPEKYSEYPLLVWPLIEKHGGKITHRVSKFETVEGDWSPKRLLILEFPEKAAARALLDDPEYQPIKDIRLGAATSLMVIGNSEM
jgi:uncharacterized protein (DUF1330 family)